MEVLTAAKIAHQVSDAPSAVSIVTAQDIHDYGYRTLAEILSSMRGLNVTNDRIYEFLGGRGFGRPGDYTGRIMLLIDGVQANDNVYNQSYLGTDGLLDTEIIDRVEYVSGPGSVSYGNNAFYGIINVITKKGKSVDGAEAGFSYGSYDSRKGRLTYGNRLENGLDLLVSASGFGSDGQNFHFPEFDDGNPANNNGNSRNQDRQHNHRLFGKIQGDHWRIETGYSDRNKHIPTAPYGSDFNVTQTYEDTSKFFSGQYHVNLSDDLKFSLQADYSDYFYHAPIPNAGSLWMEHSAGRHWNTDAKFAATWFQGQKIVFGAAYRNDYQRKQTSPALRSDQEQQNISLYAQDEIALRDNLWINLGARYDYFTDDDGTELSPRAALIYQPAPEWSVRLAHSRASRTPTAFEKYYTDGGSALPNPKLDMEHVRATEFIVEKQWGSYARLLTSVYHQTTDDPISSSPYSSGIIQFSNGRSTHAQGIEVEYEHNWSNTVRLRTSYAHQHSENGNGNWAVNSPKHLGKLNVSAPLFGNRVRTGLEIQSVSSRKTEAGNELGGYVVSNLTLGTDKLLSDLDVTFTARNLFDRKYRLAAPDYNTPIDSIEQDGRNYWLQLNYRFR